MSCHCGHVHASVDVARMSLQLFYEPEAVALEMARAVVAVVGDGPGCDCTHGHGGPGEDCSCCWCRVGFWGFEPLPILCFVCGNPWHPSSGFVMGAQDTPVCVSCARKFARWYTVRSNNRPRSREGPNFYEASGG